MHKAFLYLKASVDYATDFFIYILENNHVLVMETKRSKRTQWNNNTEFFRHTGKLHEQELLKQKEHNLPESSPFLPAWRISLMKSATFMISDVVNTSSYIFKPFTTLTWL